MRKINGDLKKCIRLLLLAFCVQCNNAKLDTNQSNSSLQFNSLDFEQIKYGLLQTGSNCLDSDCSCPNEISAINNGVNKTEDWALKRMFLLNSMCILSINSLFLAEKLMN